MSDDSQSELSSALSDIASDDALPFTTATSTQEAGQESVVKPVAAAETYGISRKRRAEEPGTSSGRTKRARRGPQPVYKEEEETEEVQQVVIASPKKRSRGDRGSIRAAVIQNTELKAGVEADLEAPANGTAKESRRKIKTKTKTEVTFETEIRAENSRVNEGTVIEKVKRKRKTKEEKEAEAMPLAARTVGSKILIGAHVSSAGGMSTMEVRHICCAMYAMNTNKFIAEFSSMLQASTTPSRIASTLGEYTSPMPLTLGAPVVLVFRLSTPARLCKTLF